MSNLATDIKDIILALNLMPKDKRTGYKYFYDYTDTITFSPTTKRLYKNYQVIKYHKTKMVTDEDTKENKVVRMRDYVVASSNLIKIYQWLGEEYNHRLGGV